MPSKRSFQDTVILPVKQLSSQMLPSSQHTVQDSVILMFEQDSYMEAQRHKEQLIQKLCNI